MKCSYLIAAITRRRCWKSISHQLSNWFIVTKTMHALSCGQLPMSLEHNANKLIHILSKLSRDVYYCTVFERETNINVFSWRAVANFTKSLDPNRPITAAIAVPMNDDKAAQFLDIISFNRYNGWYSNPGRVDMITQRVVDEAVGWNAKHKKPVLMSEYGADTVEGLHFVSNWI